MIRKQLLIGRLAAMTVALPAVGIYAVSAKASEIQSSNEDTVSGNKGASIDKAVTLQNSVKMTDQISAAVNGENIMFSPTSLNFALGMIAAGAKGETKEVLCNYLGTDDFASYAKEYLNKIKEYNTEDESYGYKSKLKIADAVWVDNNLTLQEEFKNSVTNGFGAEVENVDFSAAIAIANKVRARVGLGDLNACNPSKNLMTNKEALLEEILRERACELGLEDVRVFDMIRYKRDDLFKKPLHGLRIYRNDGGGDKPWSGTDGNAGEFPDKPSNFKYEVFALENIARSWWNNFSPKWYLAAFPPSEVNKEYGLTQNPGWN